MQTMKFSSIQIALLGTAIGLAPATVFAQDPATMPPVPNTQPGNPNQQPPNPTTQDSTGAPGMTGQMMRDKLFLRAAVEGGLLEIKLGELAAQKGSTADVKEFGQKMATDHATINADLGTVADADGVMLPKKVSKDGQAEFDKLNALSGTDFDKAYITLMVKDHHQDLRDFRQELISATDPVLKDAVLKSAKIIREHTMMIDKMATDRGIPVPAHKPPPPATP
jgi:putative membrane protein